MQVCVWIFNLVYNPRAQWADSNTRHTVDVNTAGINRDAREIYMAHVVLFDSSASIHSLPPSTAIRRSAGWRRSLLVFHGVCLMGDAPSVPECGRRLRKLLPTCLLLTQLLSVRDVNLIKLSTQPAD
ncbi:hypothetical protein OUZ56_029505 [Daphnia magna]|uniref:Uncharacterized protein n=1 Tax=Daphnia magna TaxID=35525 RepID=A0ABR0B7G4_9CRUS|nr:hypothetical protein OUZ56_029505 [Daphnia magna]